VKPSSSTPPSEYPEHEKLKAVQGESQLVGNFIEWLSAEHIEFAQYGDKSYTRERLFPMNISTEKMLARYFGIDLQKLNNEKIAMLEAIRRAA
jgi:hypothetical protein